MSGTSETERFQAHSNEYPWTWSPQHLDEFLADRRSGEKLVVVSTLRANAGVIRAFCSYLTEPRYGWASFCERVFANIPASAGTRHATRLTTTRRRRAAA